METQQAGLTVTRQTVSAALVLAIPMLAAIISGRLWLMLLGQAYVMFAFGGYLVWIARRTHIVIGVFGVGVMVGAVFLIGRHALDLYPK